MRAFLNTVVARIRGFLRPGAHDAEFDDELAAHLTLAEEEGIRSGLSPEEARRAARIQLGGLTQLREASRAASGLPWLDSLSVDVKLGVRLLFKYPGLTIVSTLALSIAIAIVAGFHAGTEFIVRPSLPVPDGDRIVAVWNHDVRRSDRGEQTVGDMLTWRRELSSLQEVGAFVLQERVVTATTGATRLVRAAEISPATFQIMRTPPLMGRPLVDADERPGSDAVAVVGFDVWQSAFGGDAGIVGKPIRIGGVEHTVVGVMPAGFRFPQSEQLWTPLRVASGGLGPGDGEAVVFSVGRLATGVTLDEAEAELEVVGARIAADLPATHGQLRSRTTSYARSFLDAGEPGLARSMGMARVLIGIVLLVVAVNVGTLVYARDAARAEEVAVRTALGAGRSRIVLQMLLEALVLASLAAVVGLAIMAWPLHLLSEVIDIALAQGMGFWVDVRLGPMTVLLVAALVLVSAVLTGVPAALKLTRGTSSVLQRAHAGASGLRFGRAATVVIVSQVAISVALLTIGASQLRTFVDEWASLRESGIDQGQYLTAQLRWDLAAPAAGARGVPVAEAVRRRETWRALGRRLAEEPDVHGVTFDAFVGLRPFAPAGVVPARLTGESFSYVVSTAPNYFEVNQTPTRAGRTFDALDAAEETRRVAIVNEAFVRALLPDGQPIGQRIHPVDSRSGRPATESLEIVGVVGDMPLLEISQRGPGWVARPTVYVPLRPTSLPIRLTVRVQGDPAQVVGRLHAVAAGIDPTLAVHQPMPLEDFNRVDGLFVRLYGFGVGFLVVAVLVLSTAGVYSMLAFTVSQRTREIGIRTALGANPGRVVAEVFSRAFVQVGSGTLLGLTIGFAGSAGPFALSKGVFDNGPAVAIAVAAIILLTGLVACGVPLRRALRIQPTEALRTD